MTDKEFERFLAAYGADLSRWPDGTGDAAARLLTASASARHRHEQAQALERALDDFAVTAPSHLALRAANGALARARMEAVSRPKGFAGIHWPSFAGGWAAFATIALILVVSGALPIHRHDHATPEDVVAFMQDMDQMKAAQAAQLRQADDMVGMLSTDEQGGEPQASHPQR